MRRIVCVIAVLCSCVLAVPARAQQQKEPEDPENERQIGLWLDQGISTGLSANKSLDVEFHERFDEGASNLFEYFVQGGLAFRLRPWFTLIPIYRYQRFPGNPTIVYENRVQLNLTLSTSRGPWRPTLRTLIEGRFADNRPASARLRFRPGVEYTLPLRMPRRPVLIVSNEFFITAGNNPFANGGSSYTQNRFQVGVRLPIADSFSVRPYYLLQSVNLPSGWDKNEIFGISLAFRIPRKTKTVRSRQPGCEGGSCPYGSKLSQKCIVSANAMAMSPCGNCTNWDCARTNVNVCCFVCNWQSGSQCPAGCTDAGNCGRSPP